MNVKIIGWLLFSSLAAAAALSISASAESAKVTKFPAGTHVGGVNIAHLTPEAARQRVTRALSRRLDFQHTLTDGRRFVKRRRRDLGIYLAVQAMLDRAAHGEKSVPLLFEIKASQLQNSLRRLAPKFAFAGKPARVDERRRKVIVVPEQNKRSLNVGTSTQSLLKQFHKHSGGRLLRLVIEQKPPVLTAKRLQGVNARLASFTTEFNPAKVKRTLNMRLAIRSINGTLLSPGEVFSLNGRVGERTQARGYRTSIIFLNGYKVPGIGAGVSQVTGTLFNAALMAGLPIVTYRTHSQPVTYLPVGRDATVAWGSFDMKFKNSTATPLYIAYGISGSHITATLYGNAKARPQKVSLKVVAQKIGPREIKAKLYRSTRRDSKVVKQKVGDSHYKWNISEWSD